MSNSLRPHWLQHTRFPCPSLSPRICSNSHPLSRWCHPTISSSALSLYQHQGLFQWVGSLHQVVKVLELQLQLHHQSFQWILSVDFQCWLVWSPCCPRDYQEAPTPQFESINSSALSLIYGPALTSIHDYWKNHSFQLYRPLLAKWCLCFLILYLSLS